ncbi:MAG: response regulator [Pedobacter sp.]|nr:MAG: response regulator [Pedobacter sp.]
MNNLPLHVLLVDDDDEDRELIRWALTSAIEQITINEMTSGQDLINWLTQQRSMPRSEVKNESEPITIILLDMHMPKLTGLETLAYLGDMSMLPYIPVVMLSSSISDQLKQRAYQQGIHLFMLKPAGANGFYRVVEAVKLCYRDAVRIREWDRLNLDFH